MADIHPVLEAVTDPDAFFEREFPGGRTRLAALVVFAFVLSFVVALVVVVQRLADAAALGPAQRSALQDTLVVTTVVSAVVFAVTAVVLAALYHVGTAVAGGSGSFEDTFVVTAWGLVPSVVGTLLGAVVFVVTFDASGAGSPEAVVARASDYQSDPLPAAIGFAVTVWQVYVVGYGLKHARNVTARQGLAVAGVVSLLLYLFQTL